MPVVLAGLFVWTIRLALRERGANGVWATIMLWAAMGTPAAIEQYDRTHGRTRLPRTNKWT